VTSSGHAAAEFNRREFSGLAHGATPPRPCQPFRIVRAKPLGGIAKTREECRSFAWASLHIHAARGRTWKQGVQVLRVDWPVYPRRAEHNTVAEYGPETAPAGLPPRSDARSGLSVAPAAGSGELADDPAHRVRDAQQDRERRAPASARGWLRGREAGPALDILANQCPYCPCRRPTSPALFFGCSATWLQPASHAHHNRSQRSSIR
jgi:hypothetical protein